MDEKDLSTIVRSLLEELKNPERHLSVIDLDFKECGIQYCIIGSLAVRCHNYLRFGDDIDVLISKETFPKIAQFFIGHGYSYRPGSEKHLYYGFGVAKFPWTSMLKVRKEKADFLCRIQEPRGLKSLVGGTRACHY